jgi:hypothetical protein
VATPTSRNLTRSGVLPKKADHEKLNDERGVKPLPVSNSRDEAESGKTKSGWVRGSFCILTPEISSEKPGLETMASRKFCTYLDGLDAKS